MTRCLPRLGSVNCSSTGAAGAFTGPILSVVRPFDGAQATAGNGSMASLLCDSQEQVAAIHAKALELGGTDEGAPGPRSGGGATVYAAYFRDLDGNKICAIHFKMG
jgi:predicted lactoylglutathione lyase